MSNHNTKIHCAAENATRAGRCKNKFYWRADMPDKAYCHIHERRLESHRVSPPLSPLPPSTPAVRSARSRLPTPPEEEDPRWSEWEDLEDGIENDGILRPRSPPTTVTGFSGCGLRPHIQHQLEQLWQEETSKRQFVYIAVGPPNTRGEFRLKLGLTRNLERRRRELRRECGLEIKERFAVMNPETVETAMLWVLNELNENPDSAVPSLRGLRGLRRETRQCPRCRRHHTEVFECTVRVLGFLKNLIQRCQQLELAAFAEVNEGRP